MLPNTHAHHKKLANGPATNTTVSKCSTKQGRKCIRTIYVWNVVMVHKFKILEHDRFQIFSLS